jgi:hypothetical protein
MRGRFMVEKPDDIEFTLTVTMTAKHWCDLRDQLEDIWPSSRLTMMINSMLSDARRIYWHDADAVSGRHDDTGRGP